MTRLALIVLASSLVALTGEALSAEQRIEGVVRRVVVTHCDATKAGGCAGTVTIDGQAHPLTIRVPLGTPISCDDERVLLHALQGRTVIVTLSSPGEVARAIQLAEAEAC